MQQYRPGRPLPGLAWRQTDQRSHPIGAMREKPVPAGRRGESSYHEAPQAPVFSGIKHAMAFFARFDPCPGLPGFSLPALQSARGPQMQGAPCARLIGI